MLVLALTHVLSLSLSLYTHTHTHTLCSGGVGRTGTYCLIDMALTRIQSGIIILFTM